MNENTFDVFKYMLIHLLLFLFQNVILKWILKLINNSTEDKNEL